MKRLLAPLYPGIVTLALIFSPFAHAADTKPTPTPIPHTIISSISANSVTASTTASSKTYKVDKHTKFTFQGKLVTVAELKTGMRVSITPTFDGKTAESINASDAPKAPAPKAPAPAPAPAASPAKK